MDRTRNNTEDDTNHEVRTGDGTPDNTDDEDFYEPPCREAARYIVACPGCGRRVQIKALRYSHVCGRDFDPFKRAVEQKKAAEAAASARMKQYSATEPPDRTEGTSARTRRGAVHGAKAQELLTIVKVLAQKRLDAFTIAFTTSSAPRRFFATFSVLSSSTSCRKNTPICLTNSDISAYGGQGISLWGW
jgi:hypothetical protein